MYIYFTIKKMFIIIKYYKIIYYMCGIFGCILHKNNDYDINLPILILNALNLLSILSLCFLLNSLILLIINYIIND